MTATKTLHHLGQSLGLDNVTRVLLNSGTLERYTGATSWAASSAHRLGQRGVSGGGRPWDAAVQGNSHPRCVDDLLVFEQQPEAYREEVLPARVKARIAVEQGSLGWDCYV